MTTSLQQFEYNNIVFHHIPNSQAPGLLGAMLIFAFCLGVISLDLVLNLEYDFKLVKKNGWKEPPSALNRIAYFFSRYGSFAFFLITLTFMNAPNTNCEHFAIAINVMWVIPLVFVDLIFVQRTLAVYSWNVSLTFFLGSLYLIYVALCAYSVIKFGNGYRIPNSNFCAYQAKSTQDQPHASVFIVFFVIMTLLDTLILLLTTHRLLEGGLLSLGKVIFKKAKKGHESQQLRNAKESNSSFGEESLKGLLLRQGILYFLVLEISRFAFLAVYYTVNNDTSFQVLICGIIVLIGPLMAGMLFRQTSEAVRRTTPTKSSGQSQGSSFGNLGGTNDPGINSFRPLLSMPSNSNSVGHDSINLAARRNDSILSIELSPKKYKSVDNFGVNMSQKSSGSLLYNLTNEAIRSEDLGQVHLDHFQQEGDELMPVNLFSSSHHRSVSQTISTSPTYSSNHQRYCSAKLPYVSQSDHGQGSGAAMTNQSPIGPQMNSFQDLPILPFPPQKRTSSKCVHAHGIAR